MQSRNLEDRFEPIHPWRWRLLTIWIVIFTIAVGWQIRTERENTDHIKVVVAQNAKLSKANTRRIRELRESRVNVSQLQKTNCGLKTFLATARKARWDAYRKRHDPADLRAVQGYEHLIIPFTDGGAGNCPIPKRLQIPSRPLSKES